MDINSIAIIDIGSNSVRYMANGKKRLTTTRLAEGISRTHELSPESIERSVAAICGYAEEARASGLRVYAYATSAVRDALNRSDFVARVRFECGVNVDVLTGEEEAELAYLGATGGEGGLVDIGGGSAQLVSGGFKLSFPMGCVRARELAVGDTLSELRQSVAKLCENVFFFPRIYIRDWTGVGGTITTLSALKLGLTEYTPELVTGSLLTRDDVETLIEKLYAMGDERPQHPLLHDRHDVIIYGALILSNIMPGMGMERLTVSESDGMDGYAMRIAEELE